MTEAFIYDAVRTPRGKGKADGSLHSVKPISLVTGLIHALLQRNGALAPAEIDDIVLGCVTPMGDQGADIAKTAAVAAGLPDTVAGVQVNRFCASGLEAVNMAAQKVRSGFEDVVLAGGVESMSQVPMGSDGGPWAMDPLTNFDSGFVPQGIGAHRERERWRHRHGSSPGCHGRHAPRDIAGRAGAPLEALRPVHAVRRWRHGYRTVIASLHPGCCSRWRSAGTSSTRGTPKTGWTAAARAGALE